MKAISTCETMDEDCVTRLGVYIVDDDPAIVDSLRILLEQSGYLVQAFSNGEEMLQSVSPETTGVLLLDVRIPGIDGLQVLEILRERHYQLKVIIVTGHGDIPMTVRAMKTGAVEFLEKPFYPETLVQAIREASKTLSTNERFQGEEVADLERFASLDPRERLILNGIVRGLSNKEIAESLDVSLRTIQFGRSRMFKKIGFANRGELMDWIVRNEIDLKYFHRD